MKVIQVLLILLTTAGLIACNSTQNPAQNAPVNPQPQTASSHIDPKALKKTIEQLYLRGSFSLWDYEEQYKLIKVSDNVYAAAANLAKGKQVDFMFSAKDASKAYANCGYLQVKHQQLTLAKKVKATCINVVLQNFVFTPKRAGVYEFFIDFNFINAPRVYVQRAY